MKIARGREQLEEFWETAKGLAFPEEVVPGREHYHEAQLHLGGDSWLNYGEAGQGETLLFVHGWANNWYSWIPVAERLKGRYRVVMLDLPGYGDSSPLSHYSVAGMADSVAAFLSGLGVRPVAVVGLSMGTFVVADLACRYPNLLEKLILISPVFRLRSHAETGAKVLHQVLESVNRRPLTQTLVKKVVERRLVAYAVSKYFNMYRFNRFLIDAYGTVGKKKMTKEAFIGMGLAVSQYDMEAAVAKIKVPALYIYGQADKYVPPLEAQQLVNQLSGDHRFAILPEAGHIVNLEQADLVAQEIEGFVSSSSGGQR